MAIIDELLGIDLEKIPSAPLKKAVENLVWEYKQEKNKALFQKEAGENIKKLLDMVKKHAPDAIKKTAKTKTQSSKPSKTIPKSKKESPDNFTMARELASTALEKLTELGIDLEDEEETIIANVRAEWEDAVNETNKSRSWALTKKAVEDTVEAAKGLSQDTRKKTLAIVDGLAVFFGASIKQGKEPQKKEGKSDHQEIIEELKALEPELEACRAAIRDYNKKKREMDGPKPKKTRHTKLKEKLLSLASLIPDNLKDDIQVQRKTEKILLTAHRELVAAWGMDKVKAKPGEEAIKEKFDAMEEKGEKGTSTKQKKP